MSLWLSDPLEFFEVVPPEHVDVIPGHGQQEGLGLARLLWVLLPGLACLRGQDFDGDDEGRVAEEGLVGGALGHAPQADARVNG